MVGLRMYLKLKETKQLRFKIFLKDEEIPSSLSTK